MVLDIHKNLLHRTYHFTFKAITVNMIIVIRVAHVY